MAYWQLVVCILFTWFGFVAAISFMEAWLKFKAPGVTLPIGLSIGKLIFGTLNKVEWLFALLSFLLLFLGNDLSNTKLILFLVVVLVLILQSVWWLPAMNKRADQIIAGVEVPKSTLHFYYVGGELVKLITLVWLASNLLLEHSSM